MSVAVMDPFHEGELEVQERLGVRELVGRVGRRMVRDHLTEEHRLFLSQLPFLVVGARNKLGRPWATIVTGPPGFVDVPDDTHIHINGLPREADALFSALSPSDEVGLLGIEPATRRRNRENGVIEKVEGEHWLVRVLMSYGNCPQYITPRRLRFRASAAAPTIASWDERLALHELVGSADTFFIATGVPSAGAEQSARSGGMDVSHRGGARGFVELVDDRTLVFPDYPGNNMFNTLGNLATDPRAGLCFVDWTRGAMLQLTGTIAIDWEPEPSERHPGAERLLRFTLEEAHFSYGLPLALEPRSATVAR